MPSTDFMEFKTFADIQGHFEIALDLLLKKRISATECGLINSINLKQAASMKSLVNDVLSSTKKVTSLVVPMVPWS